MLKLLRQRRAQKLGRQLRASGTHGEEPTFPELVSQSCTIGQMRSTKYLEWCDTLKCSRETTRRKAWEYCYIMQGLDEQLGLATGAGHEGPLRGLGFGVGKDRLAEAFASYGCRVLASDLGRAEAAKAGWVKTNQHADDLADLNRLQICHPDEFAKLVTYRTVDMNAIPSDLTGFDFVWSACALEHLGSIERGVRFVLRAMECLRPGGVALHTTELNLTSDEETVDDTSTVLFRARDIEDLATRLERQGDRLLPRNLHPGADPVDHEVDVPPYKKAPHLRLLIGKYAVTSVGLIAVRGG